MKRIILFLFISLFTFPGLVKSQSPNQVNYRFIENIWYPETQNPSDYQKERCFLDIYYPENKENFTTVVWFHGGGINSGNKYIPDRLMNQGIAVVAVNYRLHPRAKNPEYIEDAAAALAWVFKNIEQYGGSSKKIVVTGHSAGGYLAMMIGLDKKWLAIHDINANDIAALVPFSGHAITHLTIRKENGISDKQPVVDEFAPLWHVRADAPPLHLISGDRELEMLGRYEETAYMWRMMKVIGHEQTHLYELDGFNHGDMAVPGYDLLLKILMENGL
jgi:pimeloyl-ACP methyl ester carboxylesterase